jgi:glycosyltransferase involved in cell wall biosynthesis
MNISAVILTNNEERNIERCLRSLDFVDEIIIIDDYSEDKTLEKVRKLKGVKSLKVFERKLKGDFAGQRNYAMSKASCDWILFIDADEEMTKELKKEIISLDSRLRGNDSAVYYIKRRDFWWGKELKFGEIKKVREKGLIRFVKKDFGRWMGNVHEVFYTAKSTSTLNGFLNHYPHPTIKEFIQDINKYSSLRAKELYYHGKSVHIFEIIFPPFFKFILNYCIYLGFLDGPVGFTYAFMMSFHSFLVRAKLYQLSRKNYIDSGSSPE